MTTQTNTLVVGLGNIYRHDDGVGIIVARQIQGRILPGVSVFEDNCYGLALLETWQARTTVILIDATTSGGPPGTIHRINARKQQIPRGSFRCSSHGFSVSEAIELAGTLNQLPPRLLVFGIEGKDFTTGIGLSDEVEQAATQVTAQVLRKAFCVGGPFIEWQNFNFLPTNAVRI